MIQLESFAALIGTRYGIILLIKLALVVLLLALAALNRFYLTPIVTADHENTGALRGSIALECVLVVAILGVGAGWRFTPPPRAGCRDRGAARGPHSCRECDVPGTGFAGQGRQQRFCDAVDERQRQPAGSQGGHAGPQPARAWHRTDGAGGHLGQRRIVAR
ncbi:MAG: CopD family protein [Bradyrhizobium sp.]|uniref:CopD family protein n=1 Tax=Bradyrhizobium sp. TaxID=376 RepID=UPI001C29F6C4|nr:CopD family protein [Bradyrhizobium sp.]MBU6461873.1 CopD family protein [Pseudomonadota bacterium]MDE2069332.1 CopD family protein [Bradyrhizobium sp.]MDE2244366.1 CopD family protein [Bradyrhizobium sp.]MDE2468257.1 CopD family protein [Bradyrhizobium sp.]